LIKYKKNQKIAFIPMKKQRRKKIAKWNLISALRQIIEAKIEESGKLINLTIVIKWY
jgi:hypothetical protein